MSRRFVTIDGI